MKKALRWDNCQVQVNPKINNWTKVQRTILELTSSLWSLNSDSRALWNICSLLISCSLLFRSLTRWTISLIFSLSLLSISDVSPMAMSRCSFVPPRCEPELNQPALAAFAEDVKQRRCSPDSAAVNVKRPFEAPFWFTTRWSLSNVSSTVMWILILVVGVYCLVSGWYSSALKWPTTKVSFGSSSKKHFGDPPSR